MKKLTGLIVALFSLATLVTAPGALAEGETKAPTADAGEASAIADAQSRVEDTGYTDKAAELKAAVEAITKAADGATTAGAKVQFLSIIKSMDEAASYYANLHGTCVKTQATASWVCRERSSPKLQETLNSVNTVASMVSGVVVNDACSSMAKAMRIAQEGLTAYTAICSSARAACESSCSAVSSNLKRVKKTTVEYPPEKLSSCMPTMAEVTAACTTESPACAQTKKAYQGCENLKMVVTSSWDKIQPTAELDDNEKDENKKSIALKNRACTYTYANMILSAGAGIVSVVNSLKQAAKCDEDSNGTSTASSPTTTAEKCAIEANKNTPECLCLANPRLPGCANSLEKAGESAGNSAIGAQGSPNMTSTGGSGLNSSALAGGTGRDPAAAKVPDGSGSGGAGAPTGGGGGSAGLGGGGGIGGGGKPDGASGDKKGLSANILGGAGGGGGGSWGSGGYSSGADSKYRSYLPGGDKDPNKMAGQQNWTKEVTGQGGKSNWEKVRDRYRDNNSTLLNN